MPRSTDRDKIAEVVIIAMMVDFMLQDQQRARQLRVVDDPDDYVELLLIQEAQHSKAMEDMFIIISFLYSSRYLSPRTHLIPKPQYSPLYYALNIWKQHNPIEFRSLMRVEPTTFDALVAALRDHPVFTNNSENVQIDVEEQVAITLYRLGHYGNAASMREVGIWSGRGFGTVDLITRRVFTAICDARFRAMTLHPPTEEEKEHSMNWVEAKSCFGWRGGWCRVDGTGIGLYARPQHYGSNWFDRKSNYSANVQIISLIGNLRIFDLSLGLPGSTHDATAWKSTAIYQNHHLFLGEGDWIWADSAYPIHQPNGTCLPRTT